RTIVTYHWDFGDGNAANASVTTTSHVYESAGSYTVTLLITDDIGQTATKSQVVQVANPGAVPPPTASFTFSPANPGVGETVFFNATASIAAPGHTITSYAWTFGDGA